MVYFLTKNPKLGKFWRALEWKTLLYVMVISKILRPFGMFYVHLVYFKSSLCILWPFGVFYGHFVYFMSIW
jgi:hypothetical protein